MADEATTTQEQFRKNLSHILIDNSVVGPELTIGDSVLRFKSKVPVRALARLISNEDRVQGMIDYISGALVAGQDDALNAVIDNTDIDGLAAIVSDLGEAYTSFPDKS